jgi:hypothetical protein
LLLCTFTRILWGCGSQDSPPVSQKKEQSAKHDQRRIVEILPKPHPGEAFPPKPLLQGQVDPDKVEVIPPSQRGGRGVTLGEIKARRTGLKQVDPQRVEVIPPGKPGKAGMTLGAINALKASAKLTQVDPQRVEVIPPGKSGKAGMTLGAINALKARQPKVNPDFPMDRPPSGPVGEESVK